MVNQDKINKVMEPISRSKGKVLICTGIFPPDIGGSASYASSMAYALAKRNFGVNVITYSSLKGLKTNDTDGMSIVTISRK